MPPTVKGSAGVLQTHRWLLAGVKQAVPKWQWLGEAAPALPLLFWQPADGSSLFSILPLMLLWLDYLGCIGQEGETEWWRMEERREWVLRCSEGKNRWKKVALKLLPYLSSKFSLIFAVLNLSLLNWRYPPFLQSCQKFFQTHLISVKSHFVSKIWLLLLHPNHMLPLLFTSRLMLTCVPLMMSSV